jgi:hypothetical protein
MHVALAEHVGLVTKDPSLPSKRKRRRELWGGTRPERNGSGRFVHEYRLSDPDNDHYEGKITDIKSGELTKKFRAVVTAPESWVGEDEMKSKKYIKSARAARPTHKVQCTLCAAYTWR